MPDFSRNEQVVVDYLLGDLSQAETERLDELSVADDEFVNFLEQVENDLIDDYVRGELSQQKHARFESYYLTSSERRKRVEVARTLLSSIDSAKKMYSHKHSVIPASRSHYFQWVAIAAALVISLLSVYLLIQNAYLQKQIAATNKEHAILKQRQEKLVQDLAQQQSIDRQKQNETPKLFAFSLLPQLRDSASIQKITLPKGIESVVITLKLESDDFPLYKAVLKNPATNETLWRSNPEKSNQSMLVVKMPANIFISQDYILELLGVSKNGKTEIIDGYPFQLVVQ